MIIAAIDHLILGIGDLQNGMDLFEEQTGVKPVFGGVHPHLGTQNALVALGESSYLEIIAPQQTYQSLTGPFRGFESLKTLSPVGWAISISEMEKMEKQLTQAKLNHSGIIPGTRQVKDGPDLFWTTIFFLKENSPGINPFFISWSKESVHPSKATPHGCSIENITVGYSKYGIYDRLNSIIQIDEDILVNESPQDGHLLAFTLDTPRGMIKF